MNNQRRKTVARLANNVRMVLDQLAELKADEEAGIDNLPDSLRDGSKGQAMLDALSGLEDAESGLESALEGFDAAYGSDGVPL